MRLNTIFNRNEIVLLLLFVMALLFDVSMKFNPETNSLRYFTKPIAYGVLLVVFFINSGNIKSKKGLLLVSAITLFLIGDMLFINRYSAFYFNVALVCMMMAKVCFMFSFLNKQDFNVYRLLPFLAFCFIYMLLILFAIFDNVNGLSLVSVLFYLFVSLLFALFAFLRAEAVNRLSYLLVFVGVLIMFISDGLTALNMFSPIFNYTVFSSVIITLTFGVSQFFIVSGLLKEGVETITENNNLE